MVEERSLRCTRRCCTSPVTADRENRPAMTCRCGDHQSPPVRRRLPSPLTGAVEHPGLTALEQRLCAAVIPATTWVIVTGHTQLVLARSLVADQRLPGRNAAPTRPKPRQVRRGFRVITAALGTPAGAPKTLPAGRPPGLPQQDRPRAETGDHQRRTSQHRPQERPQPPRKRCNLKFPTGRDHHVA